MPPALTMVSFTDGSEKVLLLLLLVTAVVGVVVAVVGCADKSKEAFMRMARQLDRCSVCPVSTPSSTCTGASSGPSVVKGRANGTGDEAG